jgi:hypothetical protein
MAARVALTGAVAVLIWGCVHTIREIAFHGFAPVCSDGHPEYSARYCELPGGPSFLQVGAAVVVGTLALGSLWVARRRSAPAGPVRAGSALPTVQN